MVSIKKARNFLAFDNILYKNLTILQLPISLSFGAGPHYSLSLPQYGKTITVKELLSTMELMPLQYPEFR